MAIGQNSALHLHGQVCRQRLIEEEQAKAVVNKELRTVKGSLRCRLCRPHHLHGFLCDQSSLYLW
jgi:hypothetical protein